MTDTVPGRAGQCGTAHQQARLVGRRNLNCFCMKGKENELYDAWTCKLNQCTTAILNFVWFKVSSLCIFLSLCMSSIQFDATDRHYF